MPFPDTPLDLRFEMWIDGVWVDITADVYTEGRTRIRWGRPDGAARSYSAQTQLKINNAGGKYAFENPLSPNYLKIGRNTPLRIRVVTPSGRTVDQMAGEIASLPQRWNASRTKEWCPIDVSGIIRRLAQGSEPLHDSMRRFIEQGGPLAYWALTDGEDARQGSEMVTGGPGIRVRPDIGVFPRRQINWAQGTLAPWLERVAQIPPATIGLLTARLHPQTVTGWSVDHCRTGLGSSSHLRVWDFGKGTDADPRIDWMVLFDGKFGSNVIIQARAAGESSSPTTFLSTVSVPELYDDAPHHVRLTVAHANPAGTNWSLYVDGGVIASGTYAQPVHPVSSLEYGWSLQDPNGNDTGPLVLGHVAYWGPSAPAADDAYGALLGHARERAGRRIERLCSEQGVPLQVLGRLDDTPPMGPQTPATFLQILESAAAVDGGAIGEARGELALAYRTRSSRYNQGV